MSGIAVQKLDEGEEEEEEEEEVSMPSDAQLKETYTTSVEVGAQ